MKIETIVPRITKHRATLPPWISSSTSHLIKRLETITAKRTQLPATILKKKKLEGQVSKAMENDLIEFEKSNFEERVCSWIQKYLNCVRKSPEIPHVVKNGSKESVCKTEQCNMFNDYFISVFNKQTLEMPSTTPPLNKPNQTRVTPETVSKLLASLKEDKAIGYDKTGNLILKQCSHTLCKLLAMIFQTCLNKGTYPKVWNTGQVTPIFKEGNKTDVKCYRPICLLCSCWSFWKTTVWRHLLASERPIAC